MAYIGYSLVIIGLVLMIWATFAPPVIASFVRRLTLLVTHVTNRLLYGQPGRDQTPRASALELAILIPAHNEERVILKTLASVETAAKEFLVTTGLSHQGARVSVVVGLDHCSDKTEVLVRNFFAEAEAVPGFTRQVIQNNLAASKWYGLKNLLHWASDHFFSKNTDCTQWVFFVDSGSVVDRHFLTHAQKHISSNVMGIAPCYMPARAGFTERLHWKIEQSLKQIESSAGGPVSVHGAGVLYSLPHVVQAFQELDRLCPGNIWFNDDVVIPLTLRTLFPKQRIVYLKRDPAWITDAGIVSEAGIELGRRSRMLTGNLQWVVWLWLAKVGSPMAFLIASRRVARILWAYSVLAFAMGAVLVLASLIPVFSYFWPISALFIVLVAFSSNFSKRLAMAFLAGLSIPKLGYQLYKNRSISWV